MRAFLFLFIALDVFAVDITIDPTQTIVLTSFDPFDGAKTNASIPVANEIAKVLEARGWFNVMDERFNLHINQDKIARAFIVKKPTVDGIVTSLELFNETGENVALFFGKRKPGIPESEDWRKLVEDLIASNF